MQPLRCRRARDVLTLLKSSDFVRDDLIKAKALDTPPCLTLVRFHELEPRWELRVFVAAQQVKGVSQRHLNDYYPQLVREKGVILPQLLTFFEDLVKNKFPLSEFCMDVYAQPSKTYIMGFSPWRDDTDPLLFDWDELEAQEVPEFRTAEEASLRPSPYHDFRFPVDMMFAENIEQFVEQIRSQQEWQTANDESN